ncbi:polyketide synthase PksM [Clostridiales bacterium]|nr:polyketide synthase PksM [Clostridiales bacterium]
MNWGNGIAVTGIALEFPKCRSVKDFWDILKDGRCVLGNLPIKRYEQLLHYRTVNPRLGNLSDMQASFMDTIDTFDNSFFHVSPGDALQMDPSQRKCMEIIWHALEDAGCSENSLVNSKTGVFVGCASETEYKQMLRAYGYKPTPSSVLGNCFAAISGHISHYLDLKGPNMVINTVCSSSLVAVYLASLSLLNRESNIAVAGGCELRVLPHRVGLFGIESSDGITRTFDDLSDGTGTGEGVAAVVLKRYEDAVIDRDRIYAVIKGGAVNHDGQCMSFSAPNPNAQYELIKNVWTRAKINPENIGYIEAHGTGTQLGDTIEFEALSRAFADFTPQKSFCGIGSVKSNIGHLDSAAGIAGLIKAVLCLYNKQLVPSLHFLYPNREISFIDSPFYVCDRTQDWKSNACGRLCGVSSFGLTGTNCHLVLQESPTFAHDQNTEKQWYVLTVSAKTPVALKQLIDQYSHFIAELEPGNLQSLCYTSNMRRTHFEHRFVCVAHDVRSLLACLASFQSAIPVIDDGRDLDSRGNLCCELARNYLAGGSPDWSRLYDSSIKACSTPCYPFAEDHFWPSLQLAYTKQSREVSADRSTVENKNDSVIEVIKNVLGYDTIDATKSFQEISGSSIHILHIAQQLKEKFNISFKASDLLESPSITDFCKLLKFDQTYPENLDKPSIWKISKLQKRYFINSLYSKHALENVLVDYISLPLESQDNRIVDALNEVFCKHDIFRTTFRCGNGCFNAIVEDKAIMSVISHRELIDDKEFVNCVLKNCRSFSPDKLPLIQFHIFCTANHKFLVAIFHRLVCDGNSMRLLFQSFLQVYSGKKSKREIIQFQDIVKIIDEQAQKDAIHIANLYKNMYIMPARIAHLYGNPRVMDLSNLQESIENFVQTYKIGLLPFFTAICMLNRLFVLGERQFIFGIVFPGRENSQLIDVIGPFSNIVPFRYTLNEDMPLVNFFYEVSRLINDLRRYQSALFEDLYNLSGINYMSQITDIINLSEGYMREDSRGVTSLFLSNTNLRSSQEKCRSDIFWTPKKVLIHTFQGCGFSVSKENGFSIQKITSLLKSTIDGTIKDIQRKVR